MVITKKEKKKFFELLPCHCVGKYSKWFDPIFYRENES